MNARFCSIAEAAAVLTRSRDFVEKRKHEFRAVEMGGRWAIPVAELEQWIRRHTARPRVQARRPAPSYDRAFVAANLRRAALKGVRA